MDNLLDIEFKNYIVSILFKFKLNNEVDIANGESIKTVYGKEAKRTR
jgi:hypothetical protein